MLSSPVCRLRDTKPCAAGPRPKASCLASSWRGSEPAKGHQYDNHDQDGADDTNPAVPIAVAIAAEAATEAAEQKDHEEDDENEPERHGLISLGILA